jgi:hypothetical protein
MLMHTDSLTVQTTGFIVSLTVSHMRARARDIKNTYRGAFVAV